MRELEETNCEIRNAINIELPSWQFSDNLIQDEGGMYNGSKESNSVEASGGFLNSDCKYAWLSHETRLVVIDILTGHCISVWDFPDKITSVSAFPTEIGNVPLILVGLDNKAIRIKDSVGHLYIFDCCSSTILASIQVPAGVEKACVIHGGADWEEFNEKRPDSVLPRNTGLIFAALRNLQHIIIDLNRDLWTDSDYEENPITAKLEFVNDSNESSSLRNKSEPTHLAYDLMDKDIENYIGFDRKDFETTPLYDESLCSVLLSSTKTGCLITGCLGRVIIWQNDGSIGWISPTFDENAYVTHVALLEPSDDPRPFYYLWVVCRSDSPDSSAVLRMYALLFNHSDKSGESSLYFNLESKPSLKFELELEQGERLHSLQAVERENSRDASDTSLRRGEDSLLLIGTDERVLLFDLNRWYKEQMPRTMAECRNPNSVMASYRKGTQDDQLQKNVLASCYVPRSLREFPNKGPSSPEELFYPNSLTLEWVDLAKDNLIFWLARGVQSELLREITIAGPIVLVKPTETYRRCLTAGLVPFDSIPKDYNFNAEPIEQREMLLSLCLEQRWTHFLLRCVTEWSDGSASFLYPEFLRWGVQRASEIKLMADRLCVPLFDQSGNNIGESEVKTLRFCCQQLECLTTVVSKLPNAEGDLAKQRRALKRIATYLQVLLWFYDVGLLPETQEEEDDEQMALAMKIPYPRDKLIDSYKRKRRNDDSDEGKEDDYLFIDQLLARNCLPIKAQWERESGDDCPNQNGLYPPPSLQSLLRSFLTDCYNEEDVKDEENVDDLPEMAIKHSIIVYVLMDLAMLLQNSHPAIDGLITYPSAFKLSPSLIKLTQAFWLLDHEDYDRFFKIITGQLISPNDIKDWQHKLAINALLKNDQHKLALVYLRVLKPPLSTIDDQGMMINLAVEQGLVESAFHSRPPSHYGNLLTRFFQACKNNGKLKEILHLSLDPEEEEAFLKFLKENDCEEVRLIYYLQRSRHTEASDIFSINTNVHPRQSSVNQKISPAALQILSIFNSTVPEITKRFASTLCKNGTSSNEKPVIDSRSILSGNRGYYPRPMSQYREKGNEIYELAICKARETCLRTSSGVSNYIPFLGAPCSTITFSSKYAGQVNEQNDVNCVVFPEKKVLTGKRTMGMSSGNVDTNDGFVDRKKRKLDNETDSNVSDRDSDVQKYRRLSMSNVCNTPLIQRKVQSHNAGEANGFLLDTPQSILKSRQLFRRDSRSPSFDYGIDMENDGENILRRSGMGDFKPVRQIRFSMDRHSRNGDSISSANDITQDPNDEDSMNTNSSKTSAEENYYSPNVSSKSLRDRTILSDSSMTICFGGPRPRPSLTSQIDQSLKNDSSNDTNTTLNASASFQDTSYEDPKTPSVLSKSRRKSALSPVYSASILSPNTSIELSPIKKPLIFYNKKTNQDEETEDSEVQSEDESRNTTKFSEKNISKNSTIEMVTDNEDVETQNNDLKKEEREGSFNTRKDNKTEVEELEEGECEPDELEELEDGECEPDESEELEDGECEPDKSEVPEDDDGEPDETFQSLPSSTNDTIPETTRISNRSRDSIGHETDYSFSKEIQHLKENQFDDYNTSSNFEAGESGKYEHQNSNYSLTKPIFLDNRGVIKFGGLSEEYNITDDESMDAENNTKPSISLTNTEDEEKEEESEFVLNFSPSDDSNEEKKKGSPVAPKTRTINSYKEISSRPSIKSLSTSSVKTTELDINTESVDRKKRSTSVTKEVKKNNVEKADKLVHKDDTEENQQTENTSIAKKEEKSRTRKTRASSLAKEPSETDAKPPTPEKRSTRGLSSNKSTARKTRASSLAEETSEIDLKPQTPEKRSTKASTNKSTTRKTRASSLAKETSETDLKPQTPERRSIRASSVAKEKSEIDLKPQTPVKRSVRASSIAKEKNEADLKPQTPEKRSTRASSITKESTSEEQDETNKRTLRKRGNSVPKEVPSVVLETSRLQTRSRRSTSLLKEVILEESLSHLESPAGTKRGRPSRKSIDVAPSSPAANTRSRRSSIQSMPEELEEFLSVPSTLKKSSNEPPLPSKNEGRSRRAASVDSAVIVPAGKRVTRSVLAKATIVEPVIPEESAPVTKKQTTRRKRTSSVNAEDVKEAKGKTTTRGRSKRDRKASESKDYEFSLPEEAGEAPVSSQEEKTPTYQFSKPTDL